MPSGFKGKRSRRNPRPLTLLKRRLLIISILGLVVLFYIFEPDAETRGAVSGALFILGPCFIKVGMDYWKGRM